jgi:amino acid transporter
VSPSPSGKGGPRLDPRTTLKVLTWLLGAVIVVLTTLAVAEHSLDLAIAALFFLPFFLGGPAELFYIRKQQQEGKPPPTPPKFSRASLVVFCFAFAGMLVNILGSSMASSWEGWFWLSVLLGMGFCISLVAWLLSGLLRWWRRRKSHTRSAS